MESVRIISKFRLCVATGLYKAVDSKKKALGMLSATLLAMVPWMQISKAVADEVRVQPGALVAAVLAGIAIHILFLAFNMTSVGVLKLGGKENPSGNPSLAFS